MSKMVRMGRPKARLDLNEVQRDRLEAIVRRTSSAQSHVMRARIVLECAKELDNEEVAELLGTTGQTVGKWRRRFLADGLEGLFDAPRLGAPRSIDALVLCVDEKSQIQALDRAQPMLPIRPTVNVRQTDRYIRHGTTTLFAALDVATGRVIGKCFRKHRTKEFIRFLQEIDDGVPHGLDVHLVLDNLATHKTPEVKRWLLRHPRFELHFTPTKSSWLNLVESFFSLLSRRKLKRGVHRSTQALEQDIRAFLDGHNEDPTPYVWSKPANQILRSLGRYCADINGD